MSWSATLVPVVVRTVHRVVSIQWSQILAHRGGGCMPGLECTDGKEEWRCNSELWQVGVGQTLGLIAGAQRDPSEVMQQLVIQDPALSGPWTYTK